VCCHQYWKRLYQARCDTQEGRSFADGLHHPPQVAAGKISESAMNDSQAVRRSSCPKVVLVDHRDRQPSQTRVPGGAGTMDACADDEQIKCRVSEMGKVASHAPVRVTPGVSAEQVSGPERSAPRRCSDPLAYAIHAPVWRAQVNDNFSHQAKADQLDADRNQQDGEQECGAVGNPLAFNALHEQHQR
jgi:hypothetical protein